MLSSVAGFPTSRRLNNIPLYVYVTLPLSGMFFPAFYLTASLSLLLQRPFLQEAFLYALGWLRHFLWAHTFPFVFPMVALTLLPVLPPSMPWSLQHPPDHAELSLSGECLSPPFFRELVMTGTEPA